MPIGPDSTRRNLEVIFVACLSGPAPASQPALEPGLERKKMLFGCSDIIRYSHLTLYPSMLPRSSGLKKFIGGLVVSALLAITLSCSGYGSGYGNSAATRASGTARRAFVSDPVFPTNTGVGSPVLAVVDASVDELSGTFITLQTLLAGTLQGAGMMSVSPKRDRTLIFSGPDNKLGVVSNNSEALGSAISLPGPTESFSWTDNSTAFVALPTAPVTGQPAGEVLRLDIPSASPTATIPIPGAHYLVPSPDSSKILVFSDNSDSITLITPSLIATASSNSIPACSPSQTAACALPGFDRPIGAVFDNSGLTAYVLNCGPQCGGAGIGPCASFMLCTSISVLDLSQTPPKIANTIAVPAATTALLQGSTLYVAGTPTLPSDNNCSGVTPTTAATTCGRLTLINLQSFTATSIAITDGFHTRMVLSANGQLFVGSRNCTNIDVTGGEVRGCLTIANVSSGSIGASGVIAPPDNGDVTGLETVPNRTVMYVCQGGKFRVYDTATDKIQINPFPPNIIGQAVDVKMADF